MLRLLRVPPPECRLCSNSRLHYCRCSFSLNNPNMPYFFLLFLQICQTIVKLLIIFFKLFKINKNIQDTLSLCVTRNGTAHSSQYFANSFKICFADRNLLTLESLSHGLCSKCTDLIEKSCTCLLRTGGPPMSFMSFVNFSQFNLGFHEFRNCLRLVWRFLKKICKRAYAIIF